MSVADRIQAAARAGRVKRVEVTLDDQGPLTVDLLVPVGHAALEYIADSRVVGDASTGLANLQQSFGEIDELDREATTKRNLLEDARHNLNREMLSFAFKWLPRMCDEFAGLDDEGIGNIIRVSGMGESPLIFAMFDMLKASTTGGLEDGLEDLPFSSAPRPATSSTS